MLVLKNVKLLRAFKCRKRWCELDDETNERLSFNYRYGILYHFLLLHLWRLWTNTYMNYRHICKYRHKIQDTANASRSMVFVFIEVRSSPSYSSYSGTWIAHEWVRHKIFFFVYHTPDFRVLPKHFRTLLHILTVVPLDPTHILSGRPDLRVRTWTTNVRKFLQPAER